MEQVNDDASVHLMKIRSYLDRPRVLIVTGAGISAESGIPTFRGDGERWRGYLASDLATMMRFAEDPPLVWEWYCERRRKIAEAAPNAAHVALAQACAKRPGWTVVTQNVDDLHERAGQTNLAKIHGDIWTNRCFVCLKGRPDRELSYAEVPLSGCCHVVERPGVVWFGEGLPKEARMAALKAAAFAETILVVGTSGAVSTVSWLLDAAKDLRKALGREEAHVPIITVNVGETLVRADFSLNGKAGDLLPRLLA